MPNHERRLPGGHHRADTPDDLADSENGAQDARWMSFAELAKFRGIDKASAVRLVRRHRWRRQRDNEGRVLALVPLTWLANEDAEGDNLSDNLRDKPAQNPKDNSDLPAELGVAREAIRVLEDAVATLREQHAAAEARAAGAAASAAAERQRADMLRDRLDAVTAELREAQAVVAEYRNAEIIRQARGLLARVKALLRGE